MIYESPIIGQPEEAQHLPYCTPEVCRAADFDPDACDAPASEAVVPLRAAEVVCRFALRDYWRRGEIFLQGVERITADEEEFRNASYHIEGALGIPDDRTAAAYFEVAEQHLLHLRRKPLERTTWNMPAGRNASGAVEQTLDHGRLQARMMFAYLPAFRERRFEGGVRPETMQAVHAQLVDHAAAMRTLQFAGKNMGEEAAGAFAEAAVTSLLSRLQDASVFPYVASYREDHLVGNHRQRHDMYLLDGYGKLPVQIKYSNNSEQDRYDDAIAIVSLRRLADEVGRRLRLRNMGVGRTLNMLVEGLSAEAAGMELRDEQRALLQESSRYVLQTMAEKASFNGFDEHRLHQAAARAGMDLVNANMIAA